LLLTNDQKIQTYKHTGDSKVKHRRTRTLILENLTLPKMDNANESDKILRTQLTRNFATKRHANFESLQNHHEHGKKKLTLQIKTKLEQKCWRKRTSRFWKPAKMNQNFCQRRNQSRKRTQELETVPAENQTQTLT